MNRFGWICLLSVALVSVSLASCSSDVGADEQRFEISMSDCSADRYTAEMAGFGSVEYVILGMDGDACVIDMTYLTNPNPAWVNKALTVKLASPRSGEALKTAISACLEGRQPYMNDGTCAGPLLEVLGHSTLQADVAAKAVGDFSNAGCGQAYTGPAPARYPMHDPTSDTWGYLDADGKWAIAPQFIQAMAFSEGLAPVLRDGVWQVIDPSGGVVIANMGATATRSYQNWDDRKVYTSPIQGFSEGCARYTQDDGTRYYMSQDGRLWLEEATPQMQAAADAVGGQVVDIFDFHNGVARFRIDVEEFKAMDPVGFIDGTGAVAIAPRFARAEDFDAETGLAPVGVPRDVPSTFPKGWIFINAGGEQVLPKDDTLYKYPQPFSGGYAIVEDGMRKIYIDTQGRTLDIGAFTAATAFHDGIALTRRRGEDYRWINTAGDVVFDENSIGLCSTDFAQSQTFKDGLILLVVSKDGASCGEGRSVNFGGGAENYVNGEFAYIDTRGQVKWRASDVAQ